MRVMVVARLFSGLADSLAEGVWRPEGVPAIYRLLEGLSARPDVDLLTVFTSKDPNDVRFAKARQMHLEPIGDVVILPWVRHPILALFGLEGKFRELDHLIRCVWLRFRFKPDISYFTNANFFIAGLFARLGWRRVVLRFLGLHPEQKQVAMGNRGLQRWFYQSPFDQVICSMDGSGGKAYLPRLLTPGTPLEILLNGVDRRAVEPADVRRLKENFGLGDRPVVAFVGRLEPNKGCREFVAAMTEVLKQGPDAIDAVVIGNGTLYDELSVSIAEAHAEKRIQLVGQVPHDQVPAWLEIATIYVSINHFGSLSNANLEAVQAGKCVVVLDKDPVTHTDEETEDVLPRDCAVRIARENIDRGLAAAVMDLLDDDERLAAYCNCARDTAAKRFVTWDQRIDREIEMMRVLTGAS